MKNIQPRNKASMKMDIADGHVFNVTEANIKVDGKASLLRVCRGQRTWHVCREASGTWEILSVPMEKNR